MFAKVTVQIILCKLLTVAIKTCDIAIILVMKLKTCLLSGAVVRVFTREVNSYKSNLTKTVRFKPLACF